MQGESSATFKANLPVKKFETNLVYMENKIGRQKMSKKKKKESRGQQHFRGVPPDWLQNATQLISWPSIRGKHLFYVMLAKRQDDQKFDKERKTICSAA